MRSSSHARRRLGILSGVCAALILGLAGSGSASAQGPSGDPRPEGEAQEVRDLEARRLFEAARLAFLDGRFQEALEGFTRAYELSPRPILLFNIGASHDRLRHDQQALEAFRAYVEAVPDAENRSEVEARIAILEEAVAAHEQAAAAPASEVPIELSPVAPVPITPVEERESGGSVVESPWFWVVLGVVLAGGATAAVLLAIEGGGGVEAPLVGSTGVVSRAVVEW